MITLRKSHERGHANHGWLDSRHTFSFADYYDPQQMGFGPLRVINEDVIEPNRGFGMHPHRDMEIITYVIEGSLKHQDSLGNEGIIRPGELQRMTAGTGILHSEFNPSSSTPTHLLQIWIRPEQNGLAPSYEQKSVEAKADHQPLRLLASRNGREGSLTLHQRADLYGLKLNTGSSAEIGNLEDSRGWIQVVRGRLDIQGSFLQTGDGGSFERMNSLKFTAMEGSEALVFVFPKEAP